MKVKQFELWIADLHPRIGTEKGKVRPVVIIQTDLLNKSHPSTVVCPITTNVQPESNILRVHLTKGTANVKEDCDIIIDQIRAIDNSRLMHRIGQLDEEIKSKIKENIRIVLDLE
ncbi:type II toxin-antitoxin system PemK/MazF family toxin [Pontibacter sp. 172403-2]|uniref:type II toxin-antitoxin system PemK/MazF family toxin n=1 Tax=Pontibacter rufus TaxID=2791028 RepID=UPI0018AFAB3F|nr:type II toxin-antitoxin system PemK/MazF family toxin [Pontibacter sp. 172403-2]MBF9254422.1 type II toxin-antitoxin system PemK/MazF family toxin [Pontibacter sp. 172403-2]